MPVIVPNEGKISLVQSTRDQLLDGAWVKLFQSANTPYLGSAMVDFDSIEADFTTYAAVELLSWGLPIMPPGTPDPVTLTHAQVTWTCGATGNDIYGYYVVDAAQSYLLWCEEAPAPITLTNGKTLKLILKFLGQAEFLY